MSRDFGFWLLDGIYGLRALLLGSLYGWDVLRLSNCSEGRWTAIWGMLAVFFLGLLGGVYSLGLSSWLVCGFQWTWIAVAYIVVKFYWGECTNAFVDSFSCGFLSVSAFFRSFLFWLGSLRFIGPNTSWFLFCSASGLVGVFWVAFFSLFLSVVAFCCAFFCRDLGVNDVFDLWV